jgi:VWA domain-containing protein
MIYERRVITVSLLGLAIAVAAHAQADPCQQRTVIASVVNDQALPVQGLTADNFSAQIKGKPVKILSAQLDEHPHRVVVVLDSSGSMFEAERKWKMAILLASDALAASPARFRAGFIVFNDKIRVKLPVQENTQPARDSLNALTPPHRKSDKTTGGHTALWDALMAAIQMLDPPQFGDAIYVITDGGDNESKATPKELRATLVKEGIRLFIELAAEIPGGRATPEEVAGPNELVDLVEDSGGHMLFVPYTSISAQDVAALNNSRLGKPKQFQAAELYLFSLIQFAYRLEIALPAPAKKSEQWKLTASPPKDTKGRWLVNYPKRLDSCTDASSAGR